MTDEQLMTRVKEGHLQQMSVLFERYHLKLYNFFFRLTYKQSLSEDLTQNVFERLIRYRSSFNPDYAFRSWLFQIARNVRSEYYKKQNRRPTESIDPQQLNLSDDSIDTTQQQLDKEKLLEKALSLLDDAPRELLLLTRFQGMKYAEVAELMGCTEGAIKVKVHRAIKQLRQIYLRVYEY